MAGCFVFRTLSSMSRPGSLHGAHAPAAVRASTPATRGTSEAGGMQVARLFSTFPCSRPAAKTGRTALEKMDAKGDDKFWRRFMWICGFSCVSCTFGQFLDECASRCNNRSGSRLCPTCSNVKHSV